MDWSNRKQVSLLQQCVFYRFHVNTGFESESYTLISGNNPNDLSTRSPFNAWVVGD